MAQAGVGRGGGGYERSSSVELSSPPSEVDLAQSLPPTPNNNQSAQAANGSSSTIRVGAFPGGYDLDDPASKFASATPQSTSAVGGASHTSIVPLQPPLVKEKKTRKKRGVDVDKKEAPPKKPRAAPGTATSRRKLKAEVSGANAETSSVTMPRQSKIADLLTPHSNANPTSKFHDASESTGNSRSGFTMNGESMQNPSPNYPQMQPPQVAFPTPQRTSGLNYDPVRSMTISAPTTPNLQTKLPTDSLPPQSVFRASASPAISTMTNPLPPNLPQSSSTFSNPDQSQRSPSHHQFFLGSSSISGSASVDPITNCAPSASEPPTRPAEQSPSVADTTAFASTSKATTVAKQGSSGTLSAAEKSPKPARAKEAPPLPPTGSGLLSSAMFGIDPQAKEINGANTDQAPNIILHIDLKGKNNVIINFARMAEEKYGFEALYPRLAKNRARLAKVAEAGEALEKAANGGKLGGTSAEESADEDMSVDIDRDSENDGDVAMSGLNGGTGTGGNSETDVKDTKKRRRKAEEYDQDDGFVDDSELAWEQQASVSKDGYFVYSGPLVPESKEPTNDRIGGETKRGRGRGRGGGPGSRGGRGGASSAAAGGDTGSGRGGGIGSRGGTTTRKPRVTKAGRAIMEREKQDREKMAPLAAKPSGYPA